MTPKKASILEFAMVYLVFVVYFYCTDFRWVGEESPFLLMLLQKTAKVFAVLLPFLFFIRTPSRFMKLLWEQKALLVLTGYLMISIFWANDSFIATKEVCLFWIALLFSVYLVSNFSESQILFLIIGANLLGVVSSLAMWLLFPQEAWISNTKGISGDIILGLRGSYVHKNHLGFAMNLSILSVLCLWSKRQISVFLVAPLLAIFGCLLYLSRSATNYVALILILTISAASFFLFRMSLHRARRFLLGLVIGGLVLAGFGLKNRSSLAAFLNRGSSLSGRTLIWQQAFENIKMRPWVGYGFNSFWPQKGNLSRFPEAEKMWRKLGWNPPTAHNGYLDLILGLGVVGFLLMLFAFLGFFKKICTECITPNYSRPFPMFFLNYLLVFLFINIFESLLLNTRYIYLILFLAAFYSVSEKGSSKKIPMTLFFPSSKEEM